MDKLEALSSITRLSERVVRVLGQNPGKFTLQGTNTYLVGSKSPYTLIDTGEGRAEYLPLLESAIRDLPLSNASTDVVVSDIIISHWHHDHVGGLPGVLSLLRKLWDERNTSAKIPFVPPRIHKFPSSSTADKYASVLDKIPAGSYAVPSWGGIFHDLADGQQFNEDLTIIHTPGHTVDSISIHVPLDEALYTADTVLGQGTAVFEDLSQYIASLQKMLAFGGHSDVSRSTPLSIATTRKYTKLYPGHGPVVEDGPQLVSTYIKHRLEREAQIVAVLGTAPTAENHLTREPDSTWKTMSLVSTIYASYPESLWLPAAHGVDLHLQKLEKEGKVVRLGGEGIDTKWKLVTQKSKF